MSECERSRLRTMTDKTIQTTETNRLTNNTQHPCERSRIQQIELVCAFGRVRVVGSAALSCFANATLTERRRRPWWSACVLVNNCDFGSYVRHTTRCHLNIFLAFVWQYTRSTHTLNLTTNGMLRDLSKSTNNDKMSTIPTHFNAFASRVMNKIYVYIL